jgi:hypothetical protein
MPTLKVGDRGERGVARRAPGAAVAPSAEFTAPGVVVIGREEVSNPAAYRATYRAPLWPTANSGITIGIGYDLAHTTSARFRADWSAFPATTLDRLMPAVGVRGSRALCDAAEDIRIALPLAVPVFLHRMVRPHAAATRSASCSSAVPIWTTTRAAPGGPT